jgi:hypothetical protein
VAIAVLEVLLAQGCATVRSERHCEPLRVEVLTPGDRVPVRDPRVWGESGSAAERVLLRADLADALGRAGVEVCEGEAPETSAVLEAAAVAAWALADGVDVVLDTELIAYGEVRRSWLWLLVAQGFVAGVGHGVAAAAVTGNPAAGWWVGLGEFALETVTWVGGAIFASHWIDPVVVRVRAIRTGDGTLVGHWTLEGTRPPRRWLSHDPRARPERLREVADRLFEKVARRLADKLCSDAAAKEK